MHLRTWNTTMKASKFSLGTLKRNPKAYESILESFFQFIFLFSKSFLFIINIMFQF